MQPLRLRHGAHHVQMVVGCYQKEGIVGLTFFLKFERRLVAIPIKIIFKMIVIIFINGPL